MEAAAEGLWALADGWEEKGHIAEAIKCLEAICQSQVSFLPITDVKTRLRVASLLLRYSDNVMHAKSHLERAQLLLKQLPSCFELKCRAYSLLSKCYHLLGTIPAQKQTLKKALDLTKSVEKGRTVLLWACNFNLQLSNALTTEGDHETAIQVLESGLQFSEAAYCPDLELMFAVSILHVYLMQWQDVSIVEQAISRCEGLWNVLAAGTHQGDLLAKQAYKGLFVYKEMLKTFHSLRCCNYNEATIYADVLDKVMSEDNNPSLTEEQVQEQLLQEQLKHIEQQLGHYGLQAPAGAELQMRHQIVRQQLHEVSRQMHSVVKNGLTQTDKLTLGPAPLDEEWLPRGAVLVLVDLLKSLCMRPRGMFKDCHGRLERGLSRIKDDLVKLGITDTTAEADLAHTSIWIVGVYLVLWIQFLENKTIIYLTETEFVAAQEALVQILDCYRRFPTMLQSCESNIHMLVGHYAQSMGSFHEATIHFVEASKLTDSKSMQAMSQINAALSYVCLGDLSQALDLIGPVYRNMDSYMGVREKTSVLFASGVLNMKQGNLSEARARLAAGLTLTHKQLGNHQLLSQYLTVLGGMATALNDTGQARDILKSSFTLAKALRDLPTQVGVLSELTALWRVLGETAKELENSEYGTRKTEELMRFIRAAQSSGHHTQLLEFGLS
ncbi:unnamed protein product [Calypogeia fissa]